MRELKSNTLEVDTCTFVSFLPSSFATQTASLQELTGSFVKLPMTPCSNMYLQKLTVVQHVFGGHGVAIGSLLC